MPRPASAQLRPLRVLCAPPDFIVRRLRCGSAAIAPRGGLFPKYAASWARRCAASPVLAVPVAARLRGLAAGRLRRRRVERRDVGAPPIARIGLRSRACVHLRYARIAGRRSVSPLFPRVGFFGGAGCPSIRETHPAPPKKLRAEGRGRSSGNLLPHEARFSFGRARVRRCESDARSSASQSVGGRARVRREVSGSRCEIEPRAFVSRASTPASAGQHRPTRVHARSARARTARFRRAPL